MRMTLVKLDASLAGLAILPVGLFAYTDDGRVFHGFVDPDDPEDPGGWRYRVKTALEVGELGPAELVAAWREHCNDITWSIEEETVELEPGEDPEERFKAELTAVEGEHYTLLAEEENLRQIYGKGPDGPGAGDAAASP